MISAPGVGSGLDVQSIVSQLMAVESRPLQALQTSRTALDAQISAYGRFRSSMSTFQTAIKDLKSLDAFKVYAVASTNADAVTATGTSAAATGTLDVQVNRLAQSHKQGSVSVADTGTTTLGGSGDQMTITVDGNPVTFDVGGMTLSQIRSAINETDAGVTATIVSETASSHHLVLTSNETGSAQAMTLGFTGTLGTDLGMSMLNNVATLAELDSEVVIDNTYTVTRGSNNISDAVEGLTLNLKAETTDAAKLTVTRDTEAVEKSVQTFVDAYNALRTTITSLRGKELKSDSTLRSIESAIQNVFNTPPTGLTGTYEYLSQVGVSIQKDGTMKVDATALTKAIDTDFSSLANVFANDSQGYMFRLDVSLTDLLKTDGIIKSREDGIESSKKSLNTRIESMEYRLGLVEQRYRSQFNALDTMLGQMRTTSTYLTQQFG
jgi:flagellar hook-associated protein 2